MPEQKSSYFIAGLQFDDAFVHFGQNCRVNQRHLYHSTKRLV